MKRRCAVKAVVFDMDGVITDSMRYHCQAWQITLNKFGLNIPSEEIYKREGQKGIESLVDFFAIHNKPLSTPLAKTILAEREIHFKSLIKPYFIDGARSFINDLYRKGFALALVTGTARHEVVRMLPESLIKKFNVIVTGSDVDRGKPHPEPYLQALSKLAIKESECVVIENAPYGILSAKAAGLSCFALETSLSSKHLNKADDVFSGFYHLKTNVEFALL